MNYLRPQSQAMRIFVQHDEQPVSPALRAQVREQLQLALGRIATAIRAVTVRIETTPDLRGPILCSVRVTLKRETVVEASVFAAVVDSALERAILRVARATMRRVEEGKG